MWDGKQPAGDEGLVFTSQMGGPIHRSTVTHTLQREVKRAELSDALAEKLGRALTTHHMRHQHASELLARLGLPDLVFHELRHTCASLLLAQGVDPRAIMEILGHSQLSTTTDIYSHVGTELLAEAARQMDAALATAR
jgi:site-specific recombinase XerD